MNIRFHTGGPAPTRQTGAATTAPAPVRRQETPPEDALESRDQAHISAPQAFAPPLPDVQAPVAEQAKPSAPPPTNTFQVSEHGVQASGGSLNNPQSLAMESPAVLADPSASPSMLQAQAKTERTARVLQGLKTSPLEIVGTTVGQREALENVRNDAWDRFNGAITQLPPTAQESYKNVLTLVTSDFAKDESRVKAFKSASPERQAEYREEWAAVAAEKFAQKPVDWMVANGQFAVLDPATLKDLGDGARQFLEASDGLAKHRPSAAPLAPADAAAAAPKEVAEKPEPGGWRSMLSGMLSPLTHLFDKTPVASVSKVGTPVTLTQPLKLKEMEEHYVGEHLPGNDIWSTTVKYLEGAEKETYRLTVRDGKFYGDNGKPFDTAKAKSVHSSGGVAIFVMDDKGAVYASKEQKIGKFHHSSLGGGKPVAAAGELEIKDGKLTMISNRSGHYRPSSELIDQALDVLKNQGVDVSDVKKEGF